jgi:hypothetical protein
MFCLKSLDINPSQNGNILRWNKRSVFFDFDNLAALIVTAIGAGMVRKHGFATLRAF